MQQRSSRGYGRLKSIESPKLHSQRLAANALKLPSRRPTSADNLLGFYDRGCKPREGYPLGGGPGLRGPSSTNTWTTLTVKVSGKDRLHGGADLAEIVTFVRPGVTAKCEGNLAAEKPAKCDGAKVGIDESPDPSSSGTWALRSEGDGLVSIRFTGRPAGCSIYLAASAACGTAALTLAPASDSELQLWSLKPVARPR